MKEILIINLTRMGDLLQTTPLMAGLKEKHAGSRITLLANTAFSEICKGIPFIDELIVFDMKGFRNRMLDTEHSLVDNYRCLADLIQQINRKEYDLTFNVTHSPISAVLASLVNTRDIRGFIIDAEGFRIIKHPWMRYFFNVVHNRNYNPFHIADMYLKFGEVMPKRKGLIYEPEKLDDNSDVNLSYSMDIKGTDSLIGIHLGASKSDKTWPVKSYAALANLIRLNFNSRIVIFGSKEEAGLVEELESYLSEKPVNLVGKTSLAELAALLKKCDLLITNDTGPLHIATAVGTQVLDISIANVHFMETGPYGKDHYVIQADLPCTPCGFDVECKDRVCKSIVRPDAVFEIAKSLINRNIGNYSFDLSEWKNLQVYRSGFREDGYLDFTPLIKHDLKKQTFYRILYRYVWNMTFRSNNKEIEAAFRNAFREISSYYSLNRIQEITPSLKGELTVLERLLNLSEEGHEIVSKINLEASKEEPDLKLIRQTWSSIERIDPGIELIGSTCPCFRPFILLFRFGREAIEGDNLRLLSEKSAENYRALTNRASAMLELMKRTIAQIESTEDMQENEVLSRIVQHM